MKNNVRPLDGIVVLDFTHALAGPICTEILADYGARVIKIEGIEKGDISRSIINIPSMSNPIIGSDSFQGLNRNKEGISINLRDPKGIALIKEMVKTADVMVSNFRPGTMDEMGLGYDIVKEINERIIFCDISAFGDGPDKNKAGMDVVIQAIAGAVACTGEDFDHIVKPGPSLSDMTGGLAAVQGILMAIINRNNTGKGQHVHTTLQEATLQLLAKTGVALMDPSGYELEPEGLGHPELVPCQGFRTKDSWVFIAVGNNKLWDLFCKAAGIPDSVREDERFISVYGRSINRKELLKIVADNFLTDTTKNWVDRLEKAGVPVSPILTPREAFKKAKDDHLIMVDTVDHPAYGKMDVPGMAIHFSDTPGYITKPAPFLGEDTVKVIKDLLNYSDEQIAQLESEGTVKQYRKE